MYEELIREIAPKPDFNLKWYNNEDSYSEGEIEDRIVRLIAQNEPEEYVQAIADHYCWSVFYHLTHIRRNILNWYPFSGEASVLEIGCGMGALTGMLCDRCRDVTAVELSQRRATATLLRCRKKENLEIIVGNLNDIQFEKKYDYITLIGVLEYQGNYTDGTDPYRDFLKKIKTLLKPDGKLLIAIENQYGLKYWCGAGEDHTGIPFEGINQYTLSGGKCRTFSRKGLERLIRDSGFAHVFFYYPMPDYKLPTVIYSQGQLPKNENMMDMQYYYIPNAFTLVAQEKNIYKDIIDNHVFEFFANSFLVECSDSEQLGEVTFAKLSSQRLEQYQVGTAFTKEKEVIKFHLQGEKGVPHLNQILQNERELLERGINVWSDVRKENVLISGRSEAKTLEEVLLEEYGSGNTEQILKIYDDLYMDILKSSEAVSWEENLLYTLDPGMKPDREKYGVILEKGYPDMIPRNAFWMQGEICWFDQEWILEHVPAKYILYRAIALLYISFPQLDRILSVGTLFDKYGLRDAMREFQQMEELFYGAILDQLHCVEYKKIAGDAKDACVESIRRLLAYDGK